MAAIDSRWAAKWVAVNKRGRDRHFLRGSDCNVLLFHTRRQAREFIKEAYGYIAQREDLKAEPHGWRMPQAVKVKVVFSEI